jgi:hypothetical protein
MRGRVSGRAGQSSRGWLVLPLALAVVVGLVAWAFASGFVQLSSHVPRAETFSAVVLNVTSDQDGVAIEREDGTQESFAMDEATIGADLLKPGNRILLDVVYLPDKNIVVRVRTAPD